MDASTLDAISVWAEIGTAIGTAALAIATYSTLREMHSERKQDRLNKEMDNLIQPLYNTFIAPDKNKKFSISWAWSNDWELSDKYYKTKSNSISNKYLGPNELREAIDHYFAMELEQRDYNKVNNKKTKILSDAIEKRYTEIQNELDDINKKLVAASKKPRWQFWK